jgi:hypothetical protein
MARTEPLRTHLLALLALCAIAISGCNNPSTPPLPVVPAAAPAAPVKPTPTVQQWRAALASTYTESDRSDKGEGVVEFMACFGERNATGKCPDGLFFGRRDAFRKLTHFTPAGTTLNRFAADQYLGSYVAIKDCAAPNYFLKVQYSRTGGSWLFIQKVAMLVDGEVALEQDFSGSHADVERDVLPNAVKEDYHFVAGDAQRAALFQILDAKELAVRITGRKGYVNLDRRALKDLRKDVADMRLALSKIAAATEGNTPDSCN